MDDLFLSCSGFTATQSADSCQDGDEDQTLHIEIDDAGGGRFLILETERWAIDGDDESINKFATMLKKLMKAANSID